MAQKIRRQLSELLFQPIISMQFHWTGWGLVTDKMSPQLSGSVMTLHHQHSEAKAADISAYIWHNSRHAIIEAAIWFVNREKQDEIHISVRHSGPLTTKIACFSNWLFRLTDGKNVWFGARWPQTSGGLQLHMASCYQTFEISVFKIIIQWFRGSDVSPMPYWALFRAHTT